MSLFSFASMAVWLEACHCRNIIIQHYHSAFDTETPPFRFTLAISGRQLHDNSIVGMLVFNPSSLVLGV